MSLILIRHAETDAHDDHYSGQVDIPLNTQGEQQARQLATDLEPYPVTAILTSPMRRTVATAAPLATARAVAIEQCPELVEISYGELEGKEKAVIGLQLRKHHIVTPVPGGESLWQLWNRLEAVEKTLRERAARGEQLAVVGHYWSNRLLLGRLVRMPFELAIRSRDYKPANASALLLSSAPDQTLRVERWLSPTGGGPSKQ